MKQTVAPILLGVLLLFSVCSGLNAAEGSRLEPMQGDLDVVSSIGASSMVTEAYTYFVHLPVIYQQYAVPTWEQIGLEGISVRPLAVSTDGTLYAGTYKRGLHLSTDAGATWNAVDDGIITSATVSNIILDPFDVDRVYMTSMQGYPYFFISQDAGESWQPGGNDGMSHPPNRLAVDPNMPGRLFAGDIPLDQVGARIYRSMDGGMSWAMVYANQIWPSKIVVSSVNSGTVFVSSALGLYRSTDGGTGWQQLTGGLPDAFVPSVALHPTEGSVAYASAETSIYRTDDGGDTWIVWGEEHPAAGIGEWLIHPSNPEVHYASFGSLGVYLTEDGGRRWRQLNNGLTTLSIRALVLDSTLSHLYASTEDGVWVVELPKGVAQ